MNDELEAAQSALGMKVATVLAQNAYPVILGGGHEVAWGSYLGLKPWLEQQDTEHYRRKLLVLNLDAHFDLRGSRPANSGTPFDQIAQDCAKSNRLFQYACWGVAKLSNTPALYARAAEFNTDIKEDIELQESNLSSLMQSLDTLLANTDNVHLTIDLDVLPASVEPGVSAPATLGVPLATIEAIAIHVKQSGKMRIVDIAELNPSLDTDDHTARIAACLAWFLMDDL